ncbi:MAG: hypothetical protein H0V45_12945 [Actinobacteria bacterium]|nr:hypothetical protein [Actinomycetota bacterium]
MKMKWRKLVALGFACALTGAFAAPAISAPLHPNWHPDAKCNAGNGNGSETVPASDCDPGNSGGKNNGGD